MSKIRRYRLRELCAPTDLETLNTAGADLLGHAVYENAECVLFFDHDAAIAAKDAEIERLRAALREYGNHVSPCATGRSPKLLKEFGLTRWPCTCGFDAALGEVKPQDRTGEPT